MTVHALFAVGIPLCWLDPLASFVAVLRHHRRPDWSPVTVAGCAVMAVANILIPDWPWVVIFSVTGLAIAVWWWRRRKRRNVLALMGAKGRARIAAMVGAMRERAKPRPVLRPQRSPA